MKGKVLQLGKSGIPVLLIMALCSSLLWMSGTNKAEKEPGAPRAYLYGKAIASNGMELHYLRTRPSNIRLEAVHNNVTLTSYYGINGGFFTSRICSASPSSMMCPSMKRQENTAEAGAM